ncbi:DUF58 domain-containing protein [Methylomarinum vadi]|uniref:DUF58 domain-containing protein n=1 Tax=Methylomarinum vadi TaxID=438855 RepID=UPI001267B5F2|nr:DUF58 domain-containing protein [Methylomarinum vadi]
MEHMKAATDNQLTNSELVSVKLKTLVALAQKASALNLRHDQIRSGQSGGYLSRFKGRGMEFDESRLYQPGDDIRSIDWKVTARTDMPHTKIFREERERPVFISVDYRRAMAFATRGVFKSVQAAKLAALLAWAAQQHGDRIGGQIFGDHSCLELKPQNGKHAVLRLFNALVSPNFTVNSDNMTLERVLSRLLQHARPGSLVYIISDFRGLDEKSETHLLKLARHCEVALIHVYDPLESHLPAKGCYRFTDERRDIVIDTGDKQRILGYQQRFQQRLEHLQHLCQKPGLTLLNCSTADDPLEVFR